MDSSESRRTRRHTLHDREESAVGHVKKYRKRWLYGLFLSGGIILVALMVAIVALEVVYFTKDDHEQSAVRGAVVVRTTTVISLHEPTMPDKHTEGLFSSTTEVEDTDTTVTEQPDDTLNNPAGDPEAGPVADFDEGRGRPFLHPGRSTEPQTAEIGPAGQPGQPGRAIQSSPHGNPGPLGPSGPDPKPASVPLEDLPSGPVGPPGAPGSNPWPDLRKRISAPSKTTPSHVSQSSEAKVASTTPRNPDLSSGDIVSISKSDMKNLLLYLIVLLFGVGVILVICTVLFVKGYCRKICPQKGKKYSLSSCCQCENDDSDARSVSGSSPSEVREEIRLDNMSRSREGSDQASNQNQAPSSRQSQNSAETSFQAPPPYLVAMTLPSVPNVESPQANNRGPIQVVITPPAPPVSLPSYEDAMAEGSALPS